MCQIRWVDERLWRWGIWANQNRDRLGYNGTVLGRMIKQQNGRMSAYDGTCARVIEISATDEEAMETDRAICGLGAELQRVLKMKYEYRCTTGRIAIRMREFTRHSSPSTVKRWVERGHRELAKTLQE